MPQQVEISHSTVRVIGVFWNTKNPFLVPPLIPITITAEFIGRIIQFPLLISREMAQDSRFDLKGYFRQEAVSMFRQMFLN